MRRSWIKYSEFVVRITNAEHEAKESWRTIDEKKQQEIKSSSLSEWQQGAGELVRGSEKIIKVCCFSTILQTKVG
jgi:hypothetical protein